MEKNLNTYKEYMSCPIGSHGGSVGPTTQDFDPLLST